MGFYFTPHNGQPPHQDSLNHFTSKEDHLLVRPNNIKNMFLVLLPGHFCQVITHR